MALETNARNGGIQTLDNFAVPTTPADSTTGNGDFESKKPR